MRKAIVISLILIAVLIAIYFAYQHYFKAKAKGGDVPTFEEPQPTVVNLYDFYTGEPISRI